MTMNLSARRTLAWNLCSQSVQPSGIQTTSCLPTWWKLLLLVACTSGVGALAQAQDFRRPAEIRPVELAAAGSPLNSIHEEDPSTGMVISTPVSVPAEEEKQPEITANPGRPAMATSALLTPVGYAQFETGLLVAADSASFSNRSAEEETMRVTVSPFLQFIVASEPIAHTSTDREDLNQRGDSMAGLQVVMMPGHGLKPTISSSYLQLV